MNKYAFKVLSDPTWWHMNYDFDKEFDTFYKELLAHKDEVKVLSCDGFYLKLDYRGKRFDVWVENFPYAYLSRARTWDENGQEIFVERKRPSRFTAMEFNEVFGNAQDRDPMGKAVDLLLKNLREANK